MNRIPLFPSAWCCCRACRCRCTSSERYKRMISECWADGRPFGIVWFDGQTIRSVGCTARVVEGGFSVTKTAAWTS